MFSISPAELPALFHHPPCSPCLPRRQVSAVQSLLGALGAELVDACDELGATALEKAAGNHEIPWLAGVQIGNEGMIMNDP